jgi:transposase
MKTLSLDLRRRILAAYDAGDVTRQEVADRFVVSLGMVKKLIQQRAKTGDIGNLHHRAGRPRLLAAEDEKRLLELHAAQPDATLAELCERLGKPCHFVTIHRTLARLGLKFKKKTSGRRNRNART